jgi:hypothetical protein
MERSELLEKLCCARDKYIEAVEISKKEVTSVFWGFLKRYRLQLGLCYFLESLTHLNNVHEIMDEITTDSSRHYISKTSYWFDIALNHQSILYKPGVTQHIVEKCLKPRLELLNRTIKRLES